MNAPVMRTAEANGASVIEPAIGHDVLSNHPMFVVGLYGLAWARSASRNAHLLSRSVTVFADGLTLTAMCSARCPLHPTRGMLIWDRRPLAIAVGRACLVIGVSETFRRPRWTSCSISGHFSSGIHTTSAIRMPNDWVITG
ncbi:hypothetical protein LMG9964_06425 [Paraburkholderia phenoliruptrix]|uniref:Uncharacterized protein n=2 Tax=Paraburkholderia phenoliruptrix TaxID=252970 RepID=K0E0W4_9BURK|nr:hypothetical protein BUPH_08245 [Paraburkholderia phenoliruptrix BR3459a]CAB4052735.1 hypothetical protein LMG9964_06425 [Paraburkholderia phenoliruptrix]